MTASLRAEWLKLVTTRSYIWMTAAAALLSGFIVFGLIAKESPPWSLGAEQFLALPGVIGITNGLFCVVLGLRVYTEDFRYGTIAHTTFADPSRTRTALAKGMVAAVAGTLLTAASLAMIAAVVFGMTIGTGGTLDLGGTGTGVVTGMLGSGALWAVLGVGVGAIVRQPVAAVVTAFVWLLGVEQIAGTLIGPVAEYLPGQSAQVLGRGPGPDVAVAATAMTAWAALLSFVGWITLRRRDAL